MISMSQSDYFVIRLFNHLNRSSCKFFFFLSCAERIQENNLLSAGHVIFKHAKKSVHFFPSFYSNQLIMCV